MKKVKACVGLSMIHFAPFNGSTFDTPVQILHAKKIENKFKYENIQEWADNIAVINEYLYGGGEGSLTTLGLSKEERVLLFGNKSVKGGIAVSDTDSAPIGALLFERRLVGGYRRLYVVYACKCAPVDVSGSTIEEGKGEYETTGIEYSISSCEHEGVNLVYFYVDTNDPTVDQEQITNWFKAVQFPKELEELKELIVDESDADNSSTSFDGTGRIRVAKAKSNTDTNKKATVTKKSKTTKQVAEKEEVKENEETKEAQK